MFSPQSIAQYLSLLSLQYYEGTPCFDFGSKSLGKCTLMQKCSLALALFKVDGRLHNDLCVYGTGEPIVCCVDNSQVSESIYPSKYLQKVTGRKQVDALQPIREDDATTNQIAQTKMPTLTDKSSREPMEEKALEISKDVEEQNNSTNKNHGRSTSIWPGPLGITLDRPKGIEKSDVLLEPKFSKTEDHDHIQKCVDNLSGLEGICKAFDRCQISGRNAKPQICGFSFDIPMVCCPQLVDNDSIVFPDDDPEYYGTPLSESTTLDKSSPKSSLTERFDEISATKTEEKLESSKQKRFTSKWPTK